MYIVTYLYSSLVEVDFTSGCYLGQQLSTEPFVYRQIRYIKDIVI